MTENLRIILSTLQRLKKDKKKANFAYFIPEIWQNSSSLSNQIVQVDFCDFFIQKIEKLLNYQQSEQEKLINSNNDAHKPIVYNMFVRYTCAFDHNNNGSIDINQDSNESNNFAKETGTFLKAIALLDYIIELGTNIVYLLPVTSIGIDGKKGNLGSPYAIRNPYKLDENLSENILDLEVDIQFKAFVEACHLLGLKIITEFVFRTASIDSDLALEHPEWFYWIHYRKQKNKKDSSKSNIVFSPPEFLKRDEKLIIEKVLQNDLHSLPIPDESYTKQFVKTPSKVARVDGKNFGVYEKNKECIIPSAFADWPPNDKQPLWSDVTYLKLYDHPNFNYIAYNTIRYYDPKLEKMEYINNQLWDYIIDIIPYFQTNFDIDGVMIDMGHALPKTLRESLIKKSKEKKKDFILWQENFSIDENSKKEHYDAVMGYACFDESNPEKFRALLTRFEKKDIPVDFFASAETHNTHRAVNYLGGLDFSIFAWAINSIIPTLHFLHSGVELGETKPVNTGLGFTSEELEQINSEELALFSAQSLNWNHNSEILKEFRLLAKNAKLNFKKDGEFEVFNPSNLSANLTNLICFSQELTSDENSIKKLYFVGNMNNGHLSLDIELDTHDNLFSFFSTISNNHEKVKIEIINQRNTDFSLENHFKFEFRDFGFVIFTSTYEISKD